MQYKCPQNVLIQMIDCELLNLGHSVFFYSGHTIMASQSEIHNIEDSQWKHSSNSLKLLNLSNFSFKQNSWNALSFFLVMNRSHQITKHNRDEVQLDGSLDTTTLTPENLLASQPVAQPHGDLGAFAMPRLDLSPPTDNSDPNRNTGYQANRRHSGTGNSYQEMEGNISRGRHR